MGRSGTSDINDDNMSGGSQGGGKSDSESVDSTNEEGEGLSDNSEGSRQSQEPLLQATNQQVLREGDELTRSGHCVPGAFSRYVSVASWPVRRGLALEGS